MSELKQYGWDKRNRTNIRSLKSGNIFCFLLEGKGFGVGRIMTRNSLGYVAEFFDAVLEFPVVVSLLWERKGEPVIIDSYSLFDRKSEGDWRVVAHDLDYIPSPQESIRFVYGLGGGRKEVDIFDNEKPLSDGFIKLPSYSPRGDVEVKVVLGVE